ncbi:MAG: thioesterase family protein [Sporomusaceae bacterium]|nr:thioesterase family protein [Sporomusaceae bacterium]
MVSLENKVRFVETDLMGVVHHSYYFNWFEMGRVEYLRQAGILLNDLLAQGIVFPITNVSCKYRASARFDDVVLIQTTLKEVSKVKMIFTYEIIKEAGHVLLATGETENVFTNEAGKIIRLPDLYYERLVASRLEKNE